RLALPPGAVCNGHKSDCQCFGAKYKCSCPFFWRFRKSAECHCKKGWAWTAIKKRSCHNRYQWSD
uniref:Kappa-lycotoxin-Os1a n=1 Tax=Oculicosa supermirabilis TaxID=2739307 RepID=TX1_OCUSU|nr:RecName: Full=Kappa-lycotoxin-Os1a; Short=Kappa-LCTX-Os1a; AltName: Full=Toxin Osu1 [Oculicosa supermirabilis]